MEVALITDLHFGVRKNSEYFLRSHLRFLINQFIPYCKEHGIENIFMLGDTFDNRTSVNTKIFNAVLDLFQNHLRPFNVWVLVENHDSYLNSSIDINSIKFLKSLPNVKLIEKYTEVKLNGSKIGLSPWIVDYNEFYNDLDKSKPEILMGHFELAGFLFNKSRVSYTGIDSNLFANKAKKVFTGHFHTRSKKTVAGTEIVYIGSPYQLTRHDIGEERGFCILDTESLEYKYINNTESMRYIQLKFPQKFTKEMVKGNIVDVHIDYDDSYNDTKIQKYNAKIESFGSAGPPNVFIVNQEELDVDINLDDYKISSVSELMYEYVNAIEIKNKSDVYNIMLELYNESKGDL